MSIGKRLRFEILRRDGFKCRYCGTTADERELRVDHVIPETLGGTTEPSNLATACDPCNSGKSSAPPDAPVVDQVAADALRWTAALQKSAASLEEKYLVLRDAQNEFLDVWNAYKIGGRSVSLPADWDNAITRLRASGLTPILIEESVSAAMKAYKVLPDNRFRYFCGVAWNIVADLQKGALDIAVDGEVHPAQKPPTGPAGITATVAEALDEAMDGSGISLESWQYDELVEQLAQRLGGA